MSIHEMTLSFDQFAISSSRAARESAFRIVLLPGELLKVPRKHRSIRVVSGEAWVSHNGKDHALGAGDVLPLARSRHEALVSTEGQPLFLEIA